MKEFFGGKKTMIVCGAAAVMAAGQLLGRWQIPTEVWYMMAAAAGITLRLGVAAQPKDK